MASWYSGVNAHVSVKQGFTKEEKDINFAKALAKFKKKVKDYNILLDYKDNMEYIKPSAKKRHQKLQAIRRNKRQIELEND